MGTADISDSKESMLKNISRLIISVTAKNIYWMTAGNFSVVTAGFLFTIFVARNLSPGEFGIFSTLTALILILSDLGELGIGGALINFLPSLFKNKDRQNANKILKTSLLIQLIISISLAVMMIILVKFISYSVFHNADINTLNLIKLSSIGIISLMLFNFINSVFNAKEQFNINFILLTFYSYPKLILLVIILLFFKLNLNLITLVFVISPLIASMAGLYFLDLDFLRVKGFYPLKKILNFSLYLAANKLFVALFSRLDILMLSILSTTYEAGLYSAASRVAFIYPLIGGSIGTILGPKVSKLNPQESMNFTKKVLIVFIGLIFSLLAMIPFSPYIINYVFGPTYSNSITVLQLLLISNIPFLIAIPINNLLTYTFKRPGILAFSSLVQLVIILIANYFLIPLYGKYGPAISIILASLTAMIISFVSFYYYVTKNK